MSDSSPPSYSFHGPNSSHSKDNGSSSRTYHVPNYATSYANDRSKLISVKFVEDRRISRAVIVVISIFLFFAAVPLCMSLLRSTQVVELYASSARIQSPSTPKPVSEWPTSGIETIMEVNPESGPMDNIPRKASRTRGAYWEDPKPSARCLAFGKREYSARLWNLPFLSDWIQACKETEIEIHGVLIPHPSHCESKWPFGGVVGHWIVDFQEGNCLARWGRLVNKGCIKKGAKRRRFTSRLWEIKNTQDWMPICGTAPVTIEGKEIPRPTFCEDKGIWGVYGVWDLDDPKC